MSAKKKEVGGGKAVGLSNDFVDWLQKSLTTGSFGGMTAAHGFNSADPMGDTVGMAGVLNDILSGGAGKLGGSMNEMISRNTNDQVDALRARFGAGGGMSGGTPAAYGEAMLRSAQGPQMVGAIGNLQLSALMPMLQIIAGLSGKGISQRETVFQPNPWLEGITALAGGVQATGSLMSGYGAMNNGGAKG